MESSYPYVEIGTRLRAVREAYSDLSRTDWAKMNNFNKTQYSNWESGFRKIPIDAAAAISERYGLSLDWIYLGRRQGLTEESAQKFFR